MRALILAALATFGFTPVATACHAAAAEARVPSTLTWRITPSERTDGKVQFELGYRTEHDTYINSRPVDLAELQGLSPAALAGASGSAPVRFRILRDAGSFDCEGAAWRGSGTGACRFTPGLAFADDLARRGYGRADEVQL